MNAYETILEEVKNILKENDASIIAKTIEWAQNTKVEINNFKKESFGKKMNQYEYYQRLYAIAGSKTWFRVINDHSGQYLNDAVTKIIKRNFENRNEKIAVKLKKAGITKILSSEWSKSIDGFNGYFKIETDAGEKVVSIRTIIASGPIQTAHYRVLIRI